MVIEHRLFPGGNPVTLGGVNLALGDNLFHLLGFRIVVPSMSRCALVFCTATTRPLYLMLFLV